MTSSPPSSKSVANPSYTPLPADPNGYKSFEAFYPYYLGEHSHHVTRKLHILGTSISSVVLLRVILSLVPRALDLVEGSRALSPGQQRFSSAFRAYTELSAPVWKYLVGGITQAYFFAWVGHFFFERNKPATFKYPVYSLMGDMRMLSEVFTLKRKP